jgi:hypothetical protein
MPTGGMVPQRSNRDVLQRPQPHAQLRDPEPWSALTEELWRGPYRQPPQGLSLNGRWRIRTNWWRIGPARAPTNRWKGLRASMTPDYPMVDVVKVRPMEAFRLWAQFSDGREGIADLSKLVTRTGPLVEPLKDPAFFRRVFIESGAPTWPNGYDYAPSALYAEMRDAGVLRIAAAE